MEIKTTKSTSSSLPFLKILALKPLGQAEHNRQPGQQSRRRAKVFQEGVRAWAGRQASVSGSGQASGVEAWAGSPGMCVIR